MEGNGKIHMPLLPPFSDLTVTPMNETEGEETPNLFFTEISL